MILQSLQISGVGPTVRQLVYLRPNGGWLSTFHFQSTSTIFELRVASIFASAPSPSWSEFAFFLQKFSLD